MKTVILGGYGNFGARICRALLLRPEIDVVVAGRDLQRATALAAELGPRARAAQLDAYAAGFSTQLRALGAGLVIHTAGPFQQQGYAVPEAVADAGAHYIDLADGRRFVCDFPAALDARFHAQGKVAITGASTVPALSSAVIDALSAGWQRVDDIDVCIAPAQTAPRGVATMAAVLDYCGAPVQVWQDGAWTTRHGWADPQPVRFRRMRPRLGALCDIPDLELFPQQYSGVRSVMFRAALEIGMSQRALAIMARCRRLGLVRSPERFAKAMHWVAGCMDPFGSALGGMVVRLSGSDGAGRPVSAEWHIIADDDHGPEIPCMAAILLAARLARGELALTGAHTSTSLLALADFEPEFARWNMVTDCVPA
jgi:saccharopine dehydrogenase-like NADP-dependent oxidoreductase